jgi:TonB family protein
VEKALQKSLVLLISTLLISACSTTNTVATNPMTNIGETHQTIYDRPFDDDVTLATINPYYPLEAAQKGIEGYVKLSFDVSEEGKPQNIKVIQSSPAGVFEQHALKAVANWQYQTPKIGGVAVKKTGLSAHLNFDLT